MKLAFFNKNHPQINYSFFSRVFDNPKIISKILTNSHTPFFITDKSIIENRLQKIPPSIKVAYSFKTNYDVAKKYHFQFAEVVSKTELNIAIKQGYTYPSIIFNGPNKGNLHRLLSHPLTINIDNITELNSLLNYHQPLKANIGIRLNSNLHPSRFGFNIESGDAQKAINLLQKNNISISGLHVHIGSDIQNSSIYQKYSTIVNDFILQNLSHTTLKYIDFGGGYPSHTIMPGTNIQSEPNINRYIDAIITPLKSNISKETSLIIEPGRYLVDDSTSLVSQVINSKIVKNNQIVTLDVTNNMLPSCWYHQLMIKTYDQNFVQKNSNFHKSKIFGASCQESDQLYQGTIPLLIPGDFVVFFGVGAYNQSQSSNFIFPAPKSIFI